MIERRASNDEASASSGVVLCHTFNMMNDRHTVSKPYSVVIPNANNSLEESSHIVLTIYLASYTYKDGQVLKYIMKEKMVSVAKRNFVVDIHMHGLGHHVVDEDSWEVFKSSWDGTELQSIFMKTWKCDRCCQSISNANYTMDKECPKMGLLEWPYLSCQECKNAMIGLLSPMCNKFTKTYGSTCYIEYNTAAQIIVLGTLLYFYARMSLWVCRIFKRSAWEANIDTKNDSKRDTCTALSTSKRWTRDDHQGRLFRAS